MILVQSFEKDDMKFILSQKFRMYLYILIDGHSDRTYLISNNSYLYSYGILFPFFLKIFIERFEHFFKFCVN